MYVHDLYLEGAGWDAKNSSLCEPAPLELVCKLPVIHFIPTEGKKKFGGIPGGFLIVIDVFFFFFFY